MGTTVPHYLKEQTTILHSIVKETGEGRTVPPNLAFVYAQSVYAQLCMHSCVCTVVCHGLHMPPYLQKDHIMDSRHEEGRNGSSRMETRNKTERFAVPYRRTIVGQFMMNFNGLTSRRRL